MEKQKELSSLDKLKNILRRKADDGVKISVANAGWVLNLAYAAGQHKAVKDAKGLDWWQNPLNISGRTNFGTSYDIYRNVYSNLYILKYNNSFTRLQGRLSGNEVSFSENKIFTEEDIKYAFNAGRESVVENMPDLEFNQNSKGDIVADNTIFSESYHLCAIATTGKWSFYMGYDTPVEWYDTAEEAMDAANNDYRERVKQTLGL